MLPFWWDRFLDDPLFTSAVKTRWNELRNGALSDAAIFGLIDDTEYRLSSTGAIDRNYNRWKTENGNTVNHISEVNFLRNYIEQRLAWMDSEIGAW